LSKQQNETYAISYFDALQCSCVLQRFSFGTSDYGPGSPAIKPNGFLLLGKDFAKPYPSSFLNGPRIGFKMAVLSPVLSRRNAHGTFERSHKRVAGRR
jgi:hypothetical protein